MTYIKQAKTPTLIQHGENDRRVPIPNGYELRQGLEDRGVPVEMVVYKGFGHGITKPKALRAVMQHNLRGSTTTSGEIRCRTSRVRRVRQVRQVRQSSALAILLAGLCRWLWWWHRRSWGRRRHAGVGRHGRHRHSS